MRCSVESSARSTPSRTSSGSDMAARKKQKRSGAIARYTDPHGRRHRIVPRRAGARSLGRGYAAGGRRARGGRERRSDQAGRARPGARGGLRRPHGPRAPPDLPATAPRRHQAPVEARSRQAAGAAWEWRDGEVFADRTRGPRGQLLVDGPAQSLLGGHDVVSRNEVSPGRRGRPFPPTPRRAGCARRPAAVPLPSWAAPARR